MLWYYVGEEDEGTSLISRRYFFEAIDKIFCVSSQGCNRLKHLDVSWNLLTHTREELGIMRKHVITLTYLDTRNNPWQKVSH